MECRAPNPTVRVAVAPGADCTDWRGDRRRGQATLGMSRGRVIENRRSGERIVLLQTGADTNGQLLEFELFLAPGGRVPSGHVHPEQEERFTVLEGLMRFRLGGRKIQLKTGQSGTERRGGAPVFR